MTGLLPTTQKTFEPRAVREQISDLLPELVGYFSRRLADPDDAADAAGDTLVALFARLNKLPQSETELRQYAYGVARNVLSKVRRGRIKHVGLVDELKKDLRAQEQAIFLPEDSDLAVAICKLSAAEQELLLMVSWEGFGVAEAGRIMGLRPDAARKKYSRLRAKIQAALQR